MSKSPRSSKSNRILTLSGASASGVIGVVLLAYQWYIFGQRGIFTEHNVGVIYSYEYLIIVLGFALLLLAFVLSAMHFAKR